mmetsp:Transcript_11070/g.20016  ORF Transcript_11070/g.20016 Transcript_11070/m.20016 type:complete len:386 (-) Transcript_11070:1117-2274(-)|eukprot:CAMPEP_0182443018 /NCGR_PEP_ID=MMETSP1172-20130603/1863_1 /TAXON_ID=708627 /ORGANISM="Timspurckia oligopyrenoides, Strain CCMP3278" /LENGTH=385 /DNA_ID=CAMNT_0024638161 /DNA_START=51 /DNA_END=1208 /DNA_ORIENTATION=-
MGLDLRILGFLVLVSSLGTVFGQITIPAGIYSTSDSGLVDYNSFFNCSVLEFELKVDLEPSGTGSNSTIQIPSNTQLEFSSDTPDDFEQCTTPSTSTGLWTRNTTEGSVALYLDARGTSSLRDNGFWEAESGQLLCGDVDAGFWQVFQPLIEVGGVYDNGPSIAFRPGFYLEADFGGSKCAYRLQPEGSSSVCFPSHSTVELIAKSDAESNRKIRMDEVEVGMHVRSDELGSVSEVYFFSHREKNSVSKFVKIEGSLGNEIVMSESHYLFVNNRLKAAGEVVIGDRILLESGDQDSVVSVLKSAYYKGLYNPHTISGTIVVNGVVASCYTQTFPPKIAHALMAPLRLLYRLRIPILINLDTSLPDTYAKHLYPILKTLFTAINSY